MDLLIVWLKSIFAPVVWVIEFFITIVTDLVYVVQITGRFLSNLPDYFAWMPDEFWALMYVAFCLVVVYKVLGREG